MRTVLSEGLGATTKRNQLAATATRSIAAQTEDPARRGISLWDWLTHTATTSTATQTSGVEVGGRSLQQWRSTQGKYWLELRKVQHSTQQTLEQYRDPIRRSRARSPTATASAASLKTCTLLTGAASWSSLTRAQRSTQKRDAEHS